MTNTLLKETDFGLGKIEVIQHGIRYTKNIAGERKEMFMTAIEINELFTQLCKDKVSKNRYQISPKIVNSIIDKKFFPI